MNCPSVSHSFDILLVMVRENESGELIGPGDFVSKWMEGDGRGSLHANDDIYVENPSCLPAM